MGEILEVEVRIVILSRSSRQSPKADIRDDNLAIINVGKDVAEAATSIITEQRPARVGGFERSSSAERETGEARPQIQQHVVACKLWQECVGKQGLGSLFMRRFVVWLEGLGQMRRFRAVVRKGWCLRALYEEG
eukprot:scaffold70355_cov65-Attheya_sp.AAC.3